ncbi:PREDICTED: nifU-like protein 5, mitochondrial [Camelina sativa]|uniref:NifU-like protein 5, mitochondrial n=1 Tax=Camelina sativa TaxID=90675 RepID=A0ABM0YGY0_CAMSA|nr:PREDICTED: nifU-like protein 5, mitochondrial [Camelina sativa]XP_010500715.1 PREDICTED: nifU-like protein 5, mitochondrial [Camelina sativa]
MKGITRLLNSLARRTASVTCAPSCSSLLISHRPLFISAAATHLPTSLLDSRTTNTSRNSLRSSSLPLNWIVQRRTMFIQTQSTPNPSSLMFNPGKPVMEVGSADFPNSRSAMGSPLAKDIFAIDGVVRVFFGSDFVTVTKSDDVTWDVLKPEIFAVIMDFYSSGQPLFLDSQATAAKDTAIHEDDSETVAMIKELLETRIRPSVQDDGGDIEYCGFDTETGIVKLRMQGACSGCPSSSVTLKSGIENMLMHYVSEVKGVEQEFDGEEEGTSSGPME